MQDTQSRDVAGEEAADACRRVARLLGADAVAAVSDGSAPLEDVIEGRAEGLIVFPIGSNEVGEPSEADHDVAIDTLDVIRGALRRADTTFPTLLAEAATVLGADELVIAYEQGGRVRILGWPDNRRPAAVPRGVRSDLGRLDSTKAIDAATVQQLGVVMGASAPHLIGAFAARDRVELILAGHTSDPVSAKALATVGRALSIAREALTDRDAVVARRLDVERARWAGEIHDGLTQSVTASFLELQRLRTGPETDPRVADALDEATSELRRSLFDLRGILFDLTREDDPAATQSDRILAFVRGVAERWKLQVETAIECDFDSVSEDTLSALHQVIRESIANAAKHADVDRIRVAVRVADPNLIVEIADSGNGFDPDTAREAPGHLGIALIRERVADTSGTLEFVSTPGEGTRVIAALPIASTKTEGESR
ncbi:MAG: ATP-binding protein [Actinomycetota bacterium]